MVWAFVCPGQGSQAVGMGQILHQHSVEASRVFEEVDEALGQKLSSLMFEGPEDQLTLTSNAQPALMAVSVAAFRALETEFGAELIQKASFVAGHSLGEYSALALAGALSVADAARLLRLRGDAMQAAVPVGQGAMAALLGLDYDVAAQVAAEAAQGDVCEAANDNAPGQVVVSGHMAAVERALEIAKAHGAKRAILLPVSAPFHCALMQPAADAMREALSKVTLQAPKVPVVSNVSMLPESDPERIKTLLVAQVTGTVRWRESMAWMASQGGVTHMLELGAGKVLSGLMKRIAPEVETHNCAAPDDVSALAGLLKS